MFRRKEPAKPINPQAIDSLAMLQQVALGYLGRMDDRTYNEFLWQSTLIGSDKKAGLAVMIVVLAYDNHTVLADIDSEDQWNRLAQRAQVGEYREQPNVYVVDWHQYFVH